MASITELESELAQADRHIAEARARMARQFGMMRQLEAHGYDAAKAKILYREIEDGLETLLAHYDHIARELSKGVRRRS